jgi:methylenetetrahydrofolate dehydrogenase (NADP+)/methenyltetrahydrofolate cyclohydrolase
MNLLNGKTASEAYKQEIAGQVSIYLRAGKRKPHLAAILVGNDGASETYVNAKVKACAEIGFDSTLIRFENTVTKAELLEQIDRINEDTSIDGLIVQLPLPPHISEQEITLRIRVDKDVDGFHPESLGRLVLGLPGFVSATPKGILMLLKYHRINTSGMNAVVIGRSANVGTPVSILLSRNNEQGNCTVTLCHSKTKDLREHTLNADLIIAALGKPGFLKSEMVKPGAIVVDVGITRIPDSGKINGYRLSGDVDFDHVAPKCSWITPVPGGVGAMTIAALMQNTLQAYQNNCLI